MSVAGTSSSDWLAGPFFAAAGLLLVAGAAKLRGPGPTGRALVSAGLPSNQLTVRLLGIVEMVVGVACLVRPSRPFAGALAVVYLAFVAFLSYLIVARVPAASCGCLGRREVPPSNLHVALNLLAAATGILAALDPLPGLLALVADLPFSGIPFLIATIVLGYSAYLAVAWLPEVLRPGRQTDAKREPARPSGAQVAIDWEAGR